MKKIYILLSVFALCLFVTGCGSKNEEVKENNNTIENNDKEKEPIEETKELTSIEDFENEVKNLGISYTKTQMAAEYINAQSGIKLISGDSQLEIYKFDINSNAYKTAEQKQKVTMDGFGDFDAIVKNGYALMIDDNFPQYDKVIEIFNSLK